MLSVIAASMLLVPAAECGDLSGGTLVVESTPTVRFKANARRHSTPKVFDTVTEDTIEFLTEPPVNVVVGCPAPGTTKVRFTRADKVPIEDEATVPLVATGATIAGMGAVIGLVGLLVIDPEDPTASLVLGITGGSMIVVGAIPLIVAGVNVAATPPSPHVVQITLPNGEREQQMYDVETARRVRKAGGE